MKKKIIAHLSIILILSGVFCNVCNFYTRLSRNDRPFVYAEDTWQNVTNDDLVTAFKYYCKSRNLVINGSIADALTSFTTETFNNIISVLGIDPTLLQAELKKTTDGNLGLRFLFTQSGVNFYNRIFAEFLQNNDFSVGDDLDNEQIYSGKYFTDLDGNKCLVYYVNDVYCNSSHSAQVSKLGSSYKYDYLELSSKVGSSVTYNVNSNQNFSYTIYNLNQAGINPYISFDTRNSVSNEQLSLIQAYGLGTNGFPNGLIRSGHRAILYNTSNNKLYFGHFLNLYNRSDDNPATDGYYWNVIAEITDNTDNTDITVDTPQGTTINNNTYNNNYVIIYNDGDTYISDDDDEPLPTTPPSGGGGGGGGDNPTNPDIPPVDPTPTPDPTIPNWNIELPEMPEGNDWLLYGLEKKFPWDIPFNLMYMLSLFAADPETPHFEGTLDLKVVQWNYDIDLAPFDDIAGYFRNFEFIGFLIGLMLLTRKLIWG